jgi:hypothetical protein
MTPLIGVFIALFAGLLAPNLRGVIGSVLVLMGAATAVQTWNLGSGRGSNPANTIDGMSYWVVQLIIIGVVTAVALGVYRLRTRRAMRAGSSLARPAFSGRRGTTVLLGSTLIMTAALSAGAGARQHSNPPRGRRRTHPVDRCVGPGHRCDGIDRACRRSRGRCAR